MTIKINRQIIGIPAENAVLKIVIKFIDNFAHSFIIKLFTDYPLSTKMIKKFLEKLDLTRQEIKIYLAVLNSGSASIRKIAAETNINRGMVYESLKKLAQKGLITRSKTKKQEHFIAEDPEAIKTFLKNKIEKLADMENEISASLPRLKAFYRRVNQEPYIKIYEGAAGAKFILEDLLKTMKKSEIKNISPIHRQMSKNISVKTSPISTTAGPPPESRQKSLFSGKTSKKIGAVRF